MGKSRKDTEYTDESIERKVIVLPALKDLPRDTHDVLVIAAGLKAIGSAIASNAGESLAGEPGSLFAALHEASKTAEEERNDMAYVRLAVKLDQLTRMSKPGRRVGML